MLAHTDKYLIIPLLIFCLFACFKNQNCTIISPHALFLVAGEWVKMELCLAGLDVYIGILCLFCCPYLFHYFFVLPYVLHHYFIFPPPHDPVQESVGKSLDLVSFGLGWVFVCVQQGAIVCFSLFFLGGVGHLYLGIIYVFLSFFKLKQWSVSRYFRL